MYKELIKRAIEARKNSYSPYSNFSVGACVLAEDGNYYTGCNIENSAYSPTICAERVAIFKAVSVGNRKIKELAVVGSKKNTYPCGVCRQVISEFNSNTKIIIANNLDDYQEYSLDELLPYGFSLETKEGE